MEFYRPYFANSDTRTDNQSSDMIRTKIVFNTSLNNLINCVQIFRLTYSNRVTTLYLPAITFIASAMVKNPTRRDAKIHIDFCVNEMVRLGSNIPLAKAALQGLLIMGFNSNFITISTARQCLTLVDRCGDCAKTMKHAMLRGGINSS